MQHVSQGSAGFQPTMPVVYSRGDGDVEVAWMQDGAAKEVRRFRVHLGHVVEVIEREQRLRRVGTGLRHGGSMRVESDLREAVEQTLRAPAEEPAPSAPSSGEAVAPSLPATCCPAHPDSTRPRKLMMVLGQVGTELSELVRRSAAALAGYRRAMEDIELLLHFPTAKGDVGIARCSQGGYCIVWRRQIVGCYPDLQAALDSAGRGDTAKPADATDLGRLGLSSQRADWRPYPPLTRIEVTRRAASNAAISEPRATSE